MAIQYGDLRLPVERAEVDPGPAAVLGASRGCTTAVCRPPRTVPRAPTPIMRPPPRDRSAPRRCAPAPPRRRRRGRRWSAPPARRDGSGAATSGSGGRAARGRRRLAGPNPRVRVQRAGRQVAVRASPAAAAGGATPCRCGPPPPRSARCHRCRSAGCRRRLRHRDPQVDPVAQRTGEAREVAARGSVLAGALPLPRAAPTARARVERRQQREAGRHGERAVHPRDRDAPALQRLAQGVERVGAELQRLVEEQDARGARATPRRGGRAGRHRPAPGSRSCGAARGTGAREGAARAGRAAPPPSRCG